MALGFRLHQIKGQFPSLFQVDLAAAKAGDGLDVVDGVLPRPCRIRQRSALSSGKRARLQPHPRE